MKGNRSLVIAVGVVAVLILGWWLFGRGGGAGAVDLIDRFGSAEKRPPTPGVFTVEDVTLNGETKKAIAVAPSVWHSSHLQDAHSRRRLAARVGGLEAGGLDAGRRRRPLHGDRVRRPRVGRALRAGRQPVPESDRPQVDSPDGRPVGLRRRGGRRHPQHQRQPARGSGRTCATISRSGARPRLSSGRPRR